jgi:cell division protein FtsZ
MARDLVITTIGVVTEPFGFEGPDRARVAKDGIAELLQHVDTLIVIPSQKLVARPPKGTTPTELFKVVDDTIYRGVRGVTDLLLKIPYIGIDFADVRSVISGMGRAAASTVRESGENRAIRAAEQAIVDPLLDDIKFAEASGLLMSFVGGADSTLYEVDEAATRIRQEVNEDATVLFGWSRDEAMDGVLSISLTVVQDCAREPERTATRLSRRRLRLMRLQDAERPGPAPIAILWSF